MQLYFVRHGQCPSSGSGRLTDEDENLTPTGIAEAQRAAESLRTQLDDTPLSRILFSPKRRTVETAQTIAEVLNCPELLEQDVRLAERDCATYDNQLVKDVFSLSEQELIRGGMEPFESLYSRTKAMYEQVSQTYTGAVLLVGHSGNLKPLLLAAKGLPPTADVEVPPMSTDIVLRII